jgi:hypothetical protein
VKRRAAVAAALAGLVILSGPVLADGPVLPNRVVVLRGLDKITARTTVLQMAVGEEAAFGTLRITARACLETPPTEPPESAAFLEIKVVDPGREPESAFSGWMFASSPSLAALEHAVYDVWVIDCAEPLEPEPLAPEPLAPGPDVPASPATAPQANG